MLQYANEGVLHDIFRLRLVAQDGVGNPKEQRGIRLYERRKIDLRPSGLRRRQSQTVFLYHIALLFGQTDEFGDRSKIFGVKVREAYTSFESRISRLITRDW